MSEVIWDINSERDFWMHEATEEDLIGMIRHLGYTEDEFSWDRYTEEDFDGYLGDGDTEYNLQHMRDVICSEVSDGFKWNAEKELREEIIPGILEQANHKFLLIGKKVIFIFKNSGLAWYNTLLDILSRMEIITVNDYEEVEGMYTLPEDENGLYKLARHIPTVKHSVEWELKNRGDWGTTFRGLDGRELWLDVFWDCVHSNDIDWSDKDIKKYMVPIINPLYKQ